MSVKQTFAQAGSERQARANKMSDIYCRLRDASGKATTHIDHISFVLNVLYK